MKTAPLLPGKTLPTHLPVYLHRMRMKSSAGAEKNILWDYSAQKCLQRLLNRGRQRIVSEPTLRSNLWLLWQPGDREQLRQKVLNFTATAKCATASAHSKCYWDILEKTTWTLQCGKHLIENTFSSGSTSIFKKNSGVLYSRSTSNGYTQRQPNLSKFGHSNNFYWLFLPNKNTQFPSF